MKKFIAWLGIAGMCTIHANTLPSLLGAGFPPVAMTLQSILALSMLLTHALYNRFSLYAYGNAIGLAGQCVVLYLTIKG